MVNKVNSLCNYDVEVPGDVFVLPRNSSVTFREVWGNTIINSECPACWGKGKVTEPGFTQIASGLIKKDPSQVVTCPLCGGTGEFDYSRASKIEEFKEE